MDLAATLHQLGVAFEVVLQKFDLAYAALGAEREMLADTRREVESFSSATRSSLEETLASVDRRVATAEASEARALNAWKMFVAADSAAWEERVRETNELRATKLRWALQARSERAALDQEWKRLRIRKSAGWWIGPQGRRRRRWSKIKERREVREEAVLVREGAADHPDASVGGGSKRGKKGTRGRDGGQGS